MKTFAVYNRIINGIRKISGRNTTQRQSLVTKPDILDIHQKPKLSKSEKIKTKKGERYTGLDRQTVKSLQACSTEEFLEKAKKLIADSYDIPQELTAQMQILPDINKKAGMLYSFTDNIIFINPKVMKMPRFQIFSLIKHEFTHQKQNYQILRTERIGEKAVHEFANIKANIGADIFINKFANMPKEELIANMPKIGFAYTWIAALHDAVKIGPDAVKEFRKRLVENDYHIIADSINNLRLEVIKKLGTIPAESEEAKISQQYLDGFLNLYNNPFNLKAIMTTINEQEAYGAQSFALFEYLKHKFI